MSFPRYPSYKDSGVEWLGKVPAHWGVAPFKWQLEGNDGGVWGDDPDGINDTIVLRSTEQTVDGRWQLDDPAPRKLSEADISGSLLVEGDLLLTKSSGSSLHIGKTTLVTPEIAAMRCCYSNFMQRIRTRSSFSPKLAWHVLNNDLARLQFDLLSNSTTGLANLNGTMIGQIVVPVPPLAEQTTIAEFLDRETGKIDELVGEQRRLMELLKEKRQAVISHAVTRGLNPAAPLKPSGIEWLGDVPAHWEVMTLRRCATYVQTGGTPSSEPPSADLEEGLVWFTPGDFGDSLRLTASTRRISPAAVTSGEAKVFPPRSVLVVSIGATLGKVGFAEEASSANQQINAVIPNERIDGYFLAYSLLVKAEVMRFLSNASTIGIMNQEKTKDIWIAVPPPAEQAGIAAFLDTELAKFDTLTAEAQRAIDLLQERRTALISAAVTGQIDVRPLAAKKAA